MEVIKEVEPLLVTEVKDRFPMNIKDTPSKGKPGAKN